MATTVRSDGQAPLFLAILAEYPVDQRPREGNLGHPLGNAMAS
jgi:hypothetical protein